MIMGNLFTAVLIDDEPLDIKNLRSSLMDFPEINVLGEAGDADTAKSLILELRPDLLFLDVELSGDTDGLKLLSRLRELVTWEMQVVFYSAYQKYLLGALRQSAFDFLQKPYSRDDFREMMYRFLKSRSDSRQSFSFHDSVSRLLPEKDMFMIGVATGYRKLHLEDIGYFEHTKGDKQWYVHLRNQAQVQLRRNTKANDILGYCPKFVQVNQQIIINLDYLTLIDGKYCRFEAPFEQKKDVVISRHFFKVLQEKISLM